MPWNSQARRTEADEDPLFAPLALGTAAAPVVVAQLGQSLDGRIATQSGESKYINGPAALDHLHRLRAEVDAVVVGVGTVVADDPLLTVRRIAGRSPARVVIDPSGRAPADARCFGEDGAARLIVGSRATPGRAGIEVIRLDGAERRLCPRAIVAALGRRGFARILIEGGARTVSDFIAAGAVDRLHVLVAPILLGSGKPGLDLPPIAALAQALRPRTSAHLLPGGEVLFDCDLRRAAAEEPTS